MRILSWGENAEMQKRIMGEDHRNCRNRIEREEHQLNAEADLDKVQRYDRGEKKINE